MSVSDWAARDQAGVAAFYAVGHDWTWAQMQAGETPATRAAASWLDQSPVPPAHPLLLPRVISHGGNPLIRWYAVAFSDPQLETLREQLNAFIGPAGSDYHGVRATLNPADPAEAALANWTGGARVFAITVIPGRRQAVRDALTRLQNIWRLQPAPRATLLRTTEALLREFFLALTNREETAALDLLGDLRAGGRLSAENLNFLEIERLAAFGRWSEILSLPQVSQILLVARPRHVTALLVEALWRTELAPFAITADAPEVIRHFRANLSPRYHSLFRARGGVTAPPVVLAFLVAAVSADSPRREQIAPLLALLPPGPDAEFGAAIAALVPDSPAIVKQPGSPLDAARAAFHADDYETAWLRLKDIPASADSVRLMIECAVEIGTADAARTVQAAFATLPAEEAERLLAVPRRRRAWEELQKISGVGEVPPPTDWEGWFDRLDSEPNWPRLVQAAHEAASQWPLAAYHHSTQRVADLAARLLSSRSHEAEAVLRLALPHLLSFFLPDGTGVPTFLPFYATALFLLASSERFAQADWATTQTLLEAVLEAGPDRQTYAEAVNAQKELWEQFGAANRLNWALDALDLLVSHPCIDPAARDAYFTALRQTFVREHRRVRPEHWEVFRLLASDLDRSADVAALRSSRGTAPTESESGVDLAGRLIGIYTLTVSAGAHAKAAIEELFPGVEVRLNHEHVGSDRLRALAREADYLVVVTRSAAHAATNFLKEHRPARATPLIYPSGKGASSIVSALTNALSIN